MSVNVVAPLPGTILEVLVSIGDSVRENDTLVILEAMMAELPIVATRVGGVPAAVPDGTGLLANAARPDELAGAMGALLADRSLAGRLGLAARAHAVEHYSVGRMVETYLQAYRRVIRRRRS